MPRRIIVVVDDTATVSVANGTEFAREEQVISNEAANQQAMLERLENKIDAGEAFVADWANKTDAQKIDTFLLELGKMVIYLARMQANRRESAGPAS